MGLVTKGRSFGPAAPKSSDKEVSEGLLDDVCCESGVTPSLNFPQSSSRTSFDAYQHHQHNSSPLSLVATTNGSSLQALPHAKGDHAGEIASSEDYPPLPTSSPPLEGGVAAAASANGNTAAGSQLMKAEMRDEWSQPDWAQKEEEADSVFEDVDKEEESDDSGPESDSEQRDINALIDR